MVRGAGVGRECWSQELAYSQNCQKRLGCPSLWLNLVMHEEIQLDVVEGRLWGEGIKAPFHLQKK